MTRRLPAIAAALSLGVSGCAATTGGAATPAAPAPATTAQTLPMLLLSAPAVGGALHSDEVVVTREVNAPWDDSAHVATADSPDLGCLAIAGAAQRAVYDGTGWTALRGQILREPPAAPTWSHFATQTVVLFPTTQAADAFYTRSRTQWTDCSDREVTYAQQLAPEQIWQVGPVGAERNMLTVGRTQHSPQHWFCQRALSVRGTVAVDVEACDAGGSTGAAASIAAAISEHLPST